MSIDRPVALLDRIREADLLEECQLDELSRLPEALDPDPGALTRTLMRRGVLSRFQLTQLAQGKGRELCLGPFVLLDKLGQGGMGAVFKARHRRLGRVVAVKLIRREKLADSRCARRFYQEVQAAAALNHPNIVLAYDAGLAGKTHYFSMEFVDGTDLARLVTGSGPLPTALACEYARQAAVGLAHAHQKGLIHRDIKPHNLLLSTAAGAPLVKLLDMGLARLQDQGETALTQSGQVLGTPDYMAPEQALDSRKADARSDVYSLGCTLYFLLTGRAPFTGQTLTQVLLQHQLAAPPALTHVPPGLAAVVGKMMAKQPDDRYQRAAEVAEALAPFARGEAAPAADADRVRRARRARGKNPITPMRKGLIGAAAAVPLLGVLVLASTPLAGPPEKPNPGVIRRTPAKAAEVAPRPIARPGVFSDEFSGAALGPGWTSTATGAGPASLSVAESVLRVLATQVHSVQACVGVPVEGKVCFGRSPWQHFGLSGEGPDGAYWVLFSTAATSDTLFARVNANGVKTEVPLGELPGGFHDYRIEPVAGGFQFYVDGALKTTIPAAIPAGTPLKLLLSDHAGTAEAPLRVDRAGIAKVAGARTAGGRM